MPSPVTTPSTETTAAPSEKQRPRNRPQAIAETIKDWIADKGLLPGDRLPQEHQLIADLEVSKGTVREALKVLEAQGLIRTRTGPGGGAFITEVESDHTAALLANHFFFKDISIANIYQLRIALEPELVADLAGHIQESEIEELKSRMSAYTKPPASAEEEREQRVAELDFHEALAGFSKNPLLSFYCAFLVRLLKELIVCKRIYAQPNPELRERGLTYQEQLIEALRAGDSETSRAVMRAHMRAAQRLMLAREAEVTKSFLALSGAS